MSLGDTAYILYGGRRYKGRVVMIRWATPVSTEPTMVWINVPELHRGAFARKPDQVFRTSREAKAALSA